MKNFLTISASSYKNSYIISEKKIKIPTYEKYFSPVISLTCLVLCFTNLFLQEYTHGQKEGLSLGLGGLGVSLLGSPHLALLIASLNQIPHAIDIQMNSGILHFFCDESLGRHVHEPDMDTGSSVQLLFVAVA